MSRFEPSKIAVAVVTGGHTFDVPGFTRLFRSIPGIDPYIQDIDNWAHDDAKVRHLYDVTLFFSMHGVEKDSPDATPKGKVREALEALGATKQGIILLHHAILSYNGWPVWTSLVGMDERFVNFQFHHNQKLRIEVANPNHPITKGLSSFEAIDESYVMPDAQPGNGNDVLLTCDHPKSMRTIGWVRTHRQSRVFCLELGHDSVAWENPGFTTVLERGIRWCAGKGV